MNDCRCVIHQTFAGLLQSNVTCLKCGNVSSAYDPMLDISLDLLPAEKKKKQYLPSALGDGIGKHADPQLLPDDKRDVPSADKHQSFFAARRARESNSLTDCLDRYGSCFMYPLCGVSVPPA
jgi:ubiquitin carboxyl-terminal hydrolase 22/27/51